MKKILHSFFILLLCSSAIGAQTMINVAPFSFTPADITISVGETVQWDNTSGTHNVNGSQATYPGNPEDFFSGIAAIAPWTFSHTFNTPGQYNYQCDPHVGMGMIGSITVEAPVLTNALLIAGVFDAQPAAAGTKGIELYALEDIADLSVFGLGSANNGGGSDGQEFTFPAVSVSAGDCFYVADDATKFADFFGFNADFIEGSGSATATGINGDDAVELFENGVVIDVFGDINVDGTGEPWEHLDGWAYRKNATGPDGSTFVLDNWTFSGIDGLDGAPTNAEAPVPYNNCAYSLSDLTNALLIAGLFDAQPAASGAKGIELYALEDIADLSVFGLGSANNGGGSDSIEFTFPVVSVNAGDCFYVTDDSTKFADFFGFNADFVEGSGSATATGINGDDAVELFENGVVIDVFGDINVDGTGEPWEHLDGWAYRKNATGPDGSTFVLDNWTFSGIDGLDGAPTNAEAPVPFPNCTYSPVPPSILQANDDSETIEINEMININVLSNDDLPFGYETVTIDMDPSNGSAMVIMVDGSIDYTPEMDYCGDDSFTYTVCDLTSCDTATVSITINCPISYPKYSISQINTVDSEGVADSLEVTCEIGGIIYGTNLRPPNGLTHTIIDRDDADEGIGLFSNSQNFGVTLNEGDSVVVRGEIDQFGGLTQIVVDTIWVVSSGNDMHDPAVVTSISEVTESKLIKFENMTFVDVATDWTGSGSGFDVRITDGTNEFNLRIDNDVDLYSMPAPTFTNFNVTGLGGQFDGFTPPYLDGYQILPRYMQDLEEIVGVVDPEIGNSVEFYPNPVADILNIKTEISIDAIQISNVLGQKVMNIIKPQNAEELNVRNLSPGIYVITFVNQDRIWSSQFVKQ